MPLPEEGRPKLEQDALYERGGLASTDQIDSDVTPTTLYRYDAG